jgi:formylglycine-generating enzyme required for sulfatase activity
MAWIPGGPYLMGADDFYPEERPVRAVRVGGFWIDRYPVTNEQFGRFVAATGYVTAAERPPDPALYPGAPPEILVAGSMVFAPTAGPVDLHGPATWWRWTPGASWRRPRGPAGFGDDLGQHPVVHVTLEDVMAYCAWAGTNLPTEAEWECGARGGLERAVFTWGNEERPGGACMANTWQGHFPWWNTEEDGYALTSPVGSFPANGYGVFDMAGNVWEWTADWYRPARPGEGRSAASLDPHRAPLRFPRKVVKGGSHLCAPGALPPVPAGGAPAAGRRHRDEPPGVPHRDAGAELSRPGGDPPKRGTFRIMGQAVEKGPLRGRTKDLPREI